MENMLFWLIFFTLGWTLTDGSEMEQDFSWHLSKIPRLVSERTFHLTSPTFEAEAKMVLNGACGIECERELPAPSLADLEDSLSYETVFENGTRTLTRVKVEGLVPEPTQNATAQGAPARRRRRQVYGTDSRFSISDRRFLTSFPFSTAVKLSTGCSGILVSPRHVLTAAHCVHDGRGYLRGSRRRFCSVSDESSDLLYQHCDAEPGSTGSGVYLRLREPGGDNWQRKIIAVYSGHQRVDVRGARRDYNVAVRITPLKFAQLCRWARGPDASCSRG